MKTKLFLSTVVLSFLFFSCGFEAEDAIDPLENESTIPSACPSYTIQVVVHNDRHASVPGTSHEDIIEGIANLNNVFNGSNIQFELVAINDINDVSIYNLLNPDPNTSDPNLNTPWALANYHIQDQVGSFDIRKLVQFVAQNRLDIFTFDGSYTNNKIFGTAHDIGSFVTRAVVGGIQDGQVAITTNVLAQEIGHVFGLGDFESCGNIMSEAGGLGCLVSFTSLQKQTMYNNISSQALLQDASTIFYPFGALPPNTTCDGSGINYQ